MFSICISFKRYYGFEWKRCVREWDVRIIYLIWYAFTIIWHEYSFFLILVVHIYIYNGNFFCRYCLYRIQQHFFKHRGIKIGGKLKLMLFSFFLALILLFIWFLFCLFVFVINDSPDWLICWIVEIILLSAITGVSILLQVWKIIYPWLIYKT